MRGGHNLIDLTGKTFHRLLVLSHVVESDVCGRARWLCECTCKTQIIVAGACLRSGNTKSCGCWIKSVMKDNDFARIHGMHRTREYRSWISMNQRCYNVNGPDYNHYGGRGIRVCKRWRDSFAAFYYDMGKRPAGMSIDRLDNDGDYKWSNCRWATRSQQRVNQRPRHA